MEFYLFNLTKMKTKFIQLCLVLSLLVLASSCQHRYPVSLVEADSLLLSNPKTALEKLDSISMLLDTTEKADVMYYRLLKMTAKDKMGGILSDIATVSKLVDYYEENDNPCLLAKSYYLMGRVAFNLYDIARALACFHKVLDILDETENLKLRSLVYSQLGYVYSKQNNLVFAQKYYQKAFSVSSQAKDTIGMLYGLRDMAIAYDYDGDKVKAIRTFSQARNLMEKVNEDNIKQEINLQIADCYLNVNEDSVRKYLFLSLSPKLSSNAAYVAYGYYYLQNMDDSVKYYLKQMLIRGKDVQTRYDACERMTKLSFDNDDFKTANTYYGLSLLYLDSLWLENQHDKEVKGKALYEYVCQTDQISKLEKSNSRKELFIMLSCIVIVVIISLFLFYWQMTIVKKLQVQNKLKDWKFSASRFYHVNDVNKTEIIKEMELEQYLSSGKHLPEELWKQLEDQVEIYYKGFKTRLFSCCSLSEQEFRVCLLVKIGVGTSKIAILTSRAQSTISTAKQRIYKKITHEKGTAEQFDNLLESI